MVFGLGAGEGVWLAKQMRVKVWRWASSGTGRPRVSAAVGCLDRALIKPAPAPESGGIFAPREWASNLKGVLRAKLDGTGRVTRKPSKPTAPLIQGRYRGGRVR